MPTFIELVCHRFPPPAFFSFFVSALLFSLLSASNGRASSTAQQVLSVLDRRGVAVASSQVVHRAQYIETQCPHKVHRLRGTLHFSTSVPVSRLLASK